MRQSERFRHWAASLGVAYSLSSVNECSIDSMYRTGPWACLAFLKKDMDKRSNNQALGGQKGTLHPSSSHPRFRQSPVWLAALFPQWNECWRSAADEA